MRLNFATASLDWRTMATHIFREGKRSVVEASAAQQAKPALLGFDWPFSAVDRRRKSTVQMDHAPCDALRWF